MTNHTLKSGLRSLWKNRTLGFINIGGLAIGMSAAFLVLLWVENEFSFDAFQPDADREYLVTWDYNGRINTDFSPLPLTSATLQRIPAVEGATCYYLFPGADLPEIHVGEETRIEKKVMFTDSGWFRLFRYDFVAGDAQDFGNIKGAILTASLASVILGQRPRSGGISGSTAATISFRASSKTTPSIRAFNIVFFYP